jgi:hypothetical protein
MSLSNGRWTFYEAVNSRLGKSMDKDRIRLTHFAKAAG